MELSKKGAEYLKKCNRTEFLALLEIYKIKHLQEEVDMLSDLCTALAYYINKVADDKEDGLFNLNDSVRRLVIDLNRFSPDPKGRYVFDDQMLEKY